MPYRPQLVVTVEWGGAEFDFGGTDEALMALVQAMMAEGLATIEAGRIPPQVIPQLIDLFQVGCVAWRGVETPDGSPMPCGQEERARIPLVDKVQIIAEYLNAITQNQDLGSALPGMLTVSVPLGSAGQPAAGDSSTSTSAPAL